MSKTNGWARFAIKMNETDPYQEFKSLKHPMSEEGPDPFVGLYDRCYCIND